MYEGKCYGVLPFKQYNGTNAGEIFTAGSDGEDGTWSFNEDNDILTIRVTYVEATETEPAVFEEWSAPLNGYFILRSNGGIAQSLTESEFTAEFAVVLDAINEPVVTAMGIENITGTLLANATTTVSVELKPAFADTNYVAAPIVAGGLNLLANLQVDSHTIVDENHVSVVVRNKGILSLGLSGAQVIVQAVSN